MKKSYSQKNLNTNFHYLLISLYALTNVCFSVLLLIGSVYGIIGLFNKFDLSHIANSKNIAGNIFAVIAFVCLSILILGAVFLIIYVLIKNWVNSLKYSKNNNLIYYVYAKKWIEATIQICTGLVFLFALSLLFTLIVPWYKSVFTIIIATLYLSLGVINLIIWLYNFLWLKKQPKEFKQKYDSIVKELDENKKIKQEIIDSSKI